jgi:glycosyltransferase involved in cell wall biosynthesis
LDFVLLITLYRVVRKHRVDVIHAHNYEAPTIAYAIRLLLGVPVVYHAHNLMRDELSHYFRPRWFRRLATRAGSLLDRFVPPRADCVVALSQAVADDLRARGVAPERIEVIPPGISSANDSPGGSQRDPFPGEKVIVYAGNLDPYQDLHTLVEAMVEVREAEPTARLVIATHTDRAPSRRGLGSLLASDGVELRVVDGYPAVRDLLKRADVVVCPRTSWSGFPIKLLNYMEAARPIVVSEGAARALGDGPWIVVADGSSSALAKGIVRALKDPALRRRLGGAVRRRVREAHDWSKLVSRVERVYGRVTGSTAERC